MNRDQLQSEAAKFRIRNWDVIVNTFWGGDKEIEKRVMIIWSKGTKDGGRAFILYQWK